MKRLVDLPGNDRLMTRAQLLIAALPRTPESEERMLRVRRSLDASSRASAPRFVWRGALALGLVGVSAAASGPAWWGTPSPARAATESVAEAASPVAPKLAALPPVAVAMPAVSTLSGSSVVTSGAPRSAAPPATVPPQSDVARVHQAAKALRHDADPERALRLLERSGARITGPLAEEALALRIEASAARGDGRQTELAAAYLAQYPSGHYRELATRALAGKK